MGNDVETGMTNVNIINAGTEIRGNVFAAGDVQIDGKLIGSFSSNQKLVVGQSGQIEGSVSCNDCEIFGKVTGKMNITERLTLKSTGEIHLGNISANKFVIENDAQFSGVCKMHPEVSDAALSQHFFEVFEIPQPAKTKNASNGSKTRRSSKVSTSKNPSEVAKTEEVASDISTTEVAKTEEVVSEISTAEVAKIQEVSSEISTTEVAKIQEVSSEISTVEVAKIQEVSSEISTAEVAKIQEVSSEISTPEVSENQADSSEISIPEISENQAISSNDSDSDKPQKASKPPKMPPNFPITNIFKMYSLPLMTGRDDITIKYTADELNTNLTIFQKKNENEIRQLLSITEDSREWKISNAKKDISKTNANENHIKEILYRPFDNRLTYYTGKSNGFHTNPQFKICKNMLFENIGLLLPKQVSDNEFRHVFCTSLIPDVCTVSTVSKEASQLFPLYLYTEATLTSKQEELAKEENFTSEFRSYINNLYGEGVSPEQILGYIYAVLYSETYRGKYGELLKDKFARIPFTEDKKLFDKLSQLGQTLVEAHLQKVQIDLGLGKFIGQGSYTVEDVSFTEENKIGKIYINPTQYFHNVPLPVWEFRIGAYQVIDNFLKERKNSGLSGNEVNTIERIINLIAFTMKQMKEIEIITKPWI